MKKRKSTRPRPTTSQETRVQGFLIELRSATINGPLECDINALCFKYRIGKFARVAINAGFIDKYPGRNRYKWVWTGNIDDDAVAWYIQKQREHTRKLDAKRKARKAQPELELDPKPKRPIKLEGDAKMEIKRHDIPADLPFRVTDENGLHLDCGGIKIPLPCYVSGQIGGVWVSLKVNKAYTKKK